MNEWLKVFSEDQPGVQEHQQTPLCLPQIQEAGRVVLQMTTPTRISRQGSYCNSETLDAAHLLRNLHRKIHLYSLAYLETLVDMPPLDPLMHLQFDGTVHKWHRYSSRQGASMPMDGLIGTVSLEGNLTPWLMHLWLGQYTHLGKNTSFGLGQYEILQVEL
ncbi:MAG: CRISPR system precrRNA processing endoribonuclease RAMP protein Cas6 [Marinospirillum sp.]|nr:CRISPR system precrRNA processing endoribonuclease RAMP protein Cas6 [Marinospirillum sp.]